MMVKLILIKFNFLNLKHNYFLIIIDVTTLRPIFFFLIFINVLTFIPISNHEQRKVLENNILLFTCIRVANVI